jgi:hypothetical protein
MKMILEVEKKQPVQVKNFAQVEKELRALKSYGPHSFASLTREDGTYLQVAGGRVTCVLELREQPENRHFRAYLVGSSARSKTQQTIMFGGGMLQLEYDEVLFIDDVVVAFRAFFNSEPFSDEMKWRDVSKIFRNS